jgi:hypothetical protein
MTTQQPQAGWRTLSDAEFANHPHARLGGALAVIFWSAVAMVAMFIVAVAALIAFGDFFTVAMMSRMLFSGTSMTSMISGLSMIPQLMFLVWACVFAVMTTGRRPSTPTTASVMIAIWALTSVAVQIAIRYVIANNHLDIAGQRHCCRMSRSRSCWSRPSAAT